MINGDVNMFIEHTTYEELGIIYKDMKYFFRGLLHNRDHASYSFEIELWGEDFTKTVYYASADTAQDCMNKFLTEPIIDGKLFWDIEKDMEWVEIYELESKKYGGR